VHSREYSRLKQNPTPWTVDIESHLAESRRNVYVELPRRTFPWLAGPWLAGPWLGGPWLARRSAARPPNRGMSGLPDIGAAHDREDYFFREDFLYLFDGKLTPEKKSSRSPDRTKTGIPPAGHRPHQRPRRQPGAAARQHPDRHHGGKPAGRPHPRADPRHSPQPEDDSNPLIGFLLLPSRPHQGRVRSSPRPAPSTNGCDPAPAHPSSRN
jgi:hypothetical protein